MHVLGQALDLYATPGLALFWSNDFPQLPVGISHQGLMAGLQGSLHLLF